MRYQDGNSVPDVLRLLTVVVCLAVLPGVRAADPAPAVEATGAMALIPAGEFIMGAADGGTDHLPHPVQLRAFYLDKREVTNAQYLAFCQATKRALPVFWGMDEFRSGPEFPNHPVVGVSWDDAAEYAAWCGKRLPTEAEWEYAARGGRPGQPYPKGEKLDPADANFSRSGKNGPVAVGSYPPNGFGLYDMIGNVGEWVADFYDAAYYTACPKENPPGPASGKFRIIRGGGWHTGPGCSRIGYRNALPQNWQDFNIGFRCAKDCS